MGQTITSLSVVDKVFRVVINEGGTEHDDKCFVVDGPGGSGKTFLYETLWYLLKGNSKEVCAMAFTGIAATLLTEEKTVHKIF